MCSNGSTPRVHASDSAPALTSREEWKWLPLRFAERANLHPARFTSRWGHPDAMSEAQKLTMKNEVYACLAATCAIGAIVAVAARHYAAACGLIAISAFFHVAGAEPAACEHGPSRCECEQRRRLRRRGMGGMRADVVQSKAHSGVRTPDPSGQPDFDEVIATGEAPRGGFHPRTVARDFGADPSREAFEAASAPLLIDYDGDAAEGDAEGISATEADRQAQLDGTLMGANRRRSKVLSVGRPTHLQRGMSSAAAATVYRDDSSVVAMDAPNVPAHVKIRDFTKGDGRGNGDDTLGSSWSQGGAARGLRYFTPNAGMDPFNQQEMFTNAQGHDPMFPTLPSAAVSHEEGMRIIYKQTIDNDRLKMWRQSLPSVSLTPSAEQRVRLDEVMVAEREDLSTQTEAMKADFSHDDEFSNGPDASYDIDNFLATTPPGHVDPMQFSDDSATRATPGDADEASLDPLFVDA